MNASESTMADIQLPPISALKALEPRPGGQWAVYEQEGDTISLSYVLNNGTEAITYTLHQCKTEEDIRKRCAGFVYEYTNDFDTGYCDQRAGELLAELDTREATSQIYQTPSHILPEQYSTSQIQQPLQEQFLINGQTIMISPPESQTRASVQFEETAMTQQSQLYQEEQGYLTSDSQQPLPEGLASGATEWPIINGSFPTAAEIDPTSTPSIEVRMSQEDMSMLMDPWQQSWTNVNPDDTQAADEEWNAFLSHR